MNILIKEPIPFTDKCLTIITTVKRNEIKDFILNTVSDWHNINQTLKNLKTQKTTKSTRIKINGFYLRAISRGYTKDLVSYVVELLKKNYPSIDVSIMNRDVM